MFINERTVEVGMRDLRTSVATRKNRNRGTADHNKEKFEILTFREVCSVAEIEKTIEKTKRNCGVVAVIVLENYGVLCKAEA